MEISVVSIVGATPLCSQSHIPTPAYVVSAVLNDIHPEAVPALDPDFVHSSVPPPQTLRQQSKDPNAHYVLKGSFDPDKLMLTSQFLLTQVTTCKERSPHTLAPVKIRICFCLDIALDAHTSPSVSG